MLQRERGREARARAEIVITRCCYKSSTWVVYACVCNNLLVEVLRRNLSSVSNVPDAFTFSLLVLGGSGVEFVVFV